MMALEENVYAIYLKQAFHNTNNMVSSYLYAKQKQPGCKKSARPIKSHNGYK